MSSSFDVNFFFLSCYNSQLYALPDRRLSVVITEVFWSALEALMKKFRIPNISMHRKKFEVKILVFFFFFGVFFFRDIPNSYFNADASSRLWRKMTEPFSNPEVLPSLLWAKTVDLLSSQVSFIALVLPSFTHFLGDRTMESNLVLTTGLKT